MIYQRRHNFIEVPLNILRPKRIEAYEIKGTASEPAAIETFFTANVLNTILMNRGLHAVAHGPRQIFAKPIKLPIFSSITKEEWAQRWQTLPDVLQKLDLIEVFDASSRISRFIAASDRGSWSHCAMYSGDGMVLEAITSGVTERTIEVYKKPEIRLGIYRMSCSPTGDIDEGICHMRQSIGDRYGWRQLFRKGIQLLLHRHLRPGSKGFIPSPNDLIVWTEEMELVFLI